MTRQSSRRAYCAHSSRIFSFELHGEEIDPNLIISQNHEKKKEKEKEEDHNLCLNSYGSSIRPCNNYNRSRAFSFELFGEKIDPNLNHQCDDEKLEKEDDQDRFRDGNIGNSLSRSSSMEILDACNNELDLMDCGYLSDGALPNGSSHYIHDNKKGLPWTRDEHKSFLVGLGKLGKGDWRGISKKYVQTRTPTQVASHAQKYFIRKEAREKGKRRSSLFDMPDDLMRYHNNSNEHKSSNPECSKMVAFGPNMNISGLNPFNSSWTQQHNSQALFIPQQPLTIVDGSTWPGVVASRNKEDVPQTK